ncbi:serine/threonine-protein kinase [Hyphomonas sp.]|uniref:serine/threonine-protein kinase n=1 Tax=Hyphomonas sp. TaxID=87 RepID=UPI0030F955A7
MTTCEKCGADLPSDSIFCSSCGKPLRGDDIDGHTSGAVDQITPMTGLITPDPDNPTGRESKSSPTLEPGQIFAERYTIEKVIGRGGMGVVYKATDKISGKPVALKLINASHLGGERAVQRLIEEGVTARDIRHPNVVAVYDIGLSADQPFVAMEYLDGISLRSWHGRMMQRGEAVPLRVAARIIVEILDGLRAAHDAGVIHRDLKPENIILVGEPTDKAAPLKLLDFGIARAAGSLQSSSSGTGLGTPDYMAPEQRTNPDAAGPSADIYSISVMLYELLVGVVPGRHWQPPSGGRSDVPMEVDELILKGMSDNRDSRPQSATAYRQALIASVNRVPVGPDPVRPGRPGKLMGWIVGASAALIALVVSISVISSAIQPDPYGTIPFDDPDPDEPEREREPERDPEPERKPISRSDYLTGTWADGYGGYYNLRVSQNGSLSGSGHSGDGAPVNIRGGISGNALQYVISVQSMDVASGSGLQTDQCHFNYQTFDSYGNLNLSGTFHVNHEPGEPCP